MTGLDILQNGASNISNAIQENALVGTAVAGGVGLAVGGTAGYLVGKATSKRKKKTKKSKKKSSKSKKRKLKFGSKAYRKKYLGKGRRKTKHTKGTSHKRIRMTKKGQPYVILSNGRARFISKRSASNSKKRKGGRY